MKGFMPLQTLLTQVVADFFHLSSLLSPYFVFSYITIDRLECNVYSNYLGLIPYFVTLAVTPGQIT